MLFGLPYLYYFDKHCRGLSPAGMSSLPSPSQVGERTRSVKVRKVVGGDKNSLTFVGGVGRIIVRKITNGEK